MLDHTGKLQNMEDERKRLSMLFRRTVFNPSKCNVLIPERMKSSGSNKEMKSLIGSGQRFDYGTGISNVRKRRRLSLVTIIGVGQLFKPPFMEGARDRIFHLENAVRLGSVTRVSNHSSK